MPAVSVHTFPVSSLTAQVLAELEHRTVHATRTRPAGKKTKNASTDPKWALDAVEAAVAASLTTASTVPLVAPGDADNHPWQRTLTDRALQNVTTMLHHPVTISALAAGHEVTFDISQSGKRVRPSVNYVGCQLPCGDTWLAQRGRLAVAIEKLRLQKIFVDYNVLSTVQDMNAVLYQCLCLVESHWQLCIAGVSYI